MSATALAHLGETTWGERFLLARRRSGLGFREAAQLVSTVAPISYASLIRLEKESEVPTDRKRRFVALLALVVYGIDPEDFGLSLSDIPASIDRQRLMKALLKARAEAKRLLLEVPAQRAAA